MSFLPLVRRGVAHTWSGTNPSHCKYMQCMRIRVLFRQKNLHSGTAWSTFAANFAKRSWKHIVCQFFLNRSVEFGPYLAQAVLEAQKKSGFGVKSDFLHMS